LTKGRTKQQKNGKNKTMDDNEQNNFSNNPTISGVFRLKLDLEI
jgi:hypothetical protein